MLCSWVASWSSASWSAIRQSGTFCWAARCQSGLRCLALRLMALLQWSDVRALVTCSDCCSGPDSRHCCSHWHWRSDLARLADSTPDSVDESEVGVVTSHWLSGWTWARPSSDWWICRLKVVLLGCACGEPRSSPWTWLTDLGSLVEAHLLCRLTASCLDAHSRHPRLARTLLGMQDRCYQSHASGDGNLGIRSLAACSPWLGKHWSSWPAVVGRDCLHGQAYPNSNFCRSPNLATYRFAVCQTQQLLVTFIKQVESS